MLRFPKKIWQRLIKQLSCHRMRRRILTWISNWLKDRKQRIGIMVLRYWLLGYWWSSSGTGRTCIVPVMWGMEKDVNADVTKCAVDTKEVRIVQIKAACEALQRYLTMLSDKTIKWEREFSVDECKIIYMVKSNRNYMYTMMGSNYLPSVKKSILESSWVVLNTPAQCLGAVRKTNWTSEIRKGVENKPESITMPVHKSWCAHILVVIFYLKKDNIEVKRYRNGWVQKWIRREMRSRC